MQKLDKVAYCGNEKLQFIIEKNVEIHSNEYYLSILKAILKSI